MSSHKAFTLPVTMDEILARCRADGDCMVWTGSLSSKGRPWWHHKTGEHLSVSRMVVEIRTGHRIPYGVFACVTCRTRGCVTHVTGMTRSEVMLRSIAEGRHGGPVRSHKIAMALRENGKLQQADVDEMRRLRTENGQTLTSLAAKFGVHTSLVGRICAGQAWASHIKGASVFTWAGS